MKYLPIMGGGYGKEVLHLLAVLGMVGDGWGWLGIVGWLDGWMAGWMDGWLDGWIWTGWLGVVADGWMGGWLNG